MDNEQNGSTAVASSGLLADLKALQTEMMGFAEQVIDPPESRMRFVNHARAAGEAQDAIEDMRTEIDRLHDVLHKALVLAQPVRIDGVPLGELLKLLSAEEQAVCECGRTEAETNAGVDAECCPICLIQERDKLRNALEVMNHHVHGISGYDWNADPDNVTLLVGEALSANAAGEVRRNAVTSTGLLGSEVTP